VRTNQGPKETMARKSSQTHRKHIPQRTCVACRQVRAARELLRIVRLPSGAVELDETHKKPGRGAYLCHSRVCWETALSKRLLEHALKTEMAGDEREALRRRYDMLPDEHPDEVAAQTTP
jgi:predicted RNA-binding protein YlxR (DUF448 family)